MAGKQRRPGPGEKGGGGRATVDAGKILGAVLGGGGDNPAYGQDPGNSEINPDISKYGVDNPYKPLNWLGSVTGQQDYYSQFRYQKAVQDANFLHEKELQAIKNSDMTEQEKLRAANNSKLQRDNHIQAALVAQGIAPTEEAQRTATDAQRPLVASLASTAGNRMINENQLATTGADIANRRLLDPQGEMERTASLSAQDAAHAAINEHTLAAAWAAKHPTLGPGSAMLSPELFGAGTSIMNDKAPTFQEQYMARAMGIPLPGPNVLQTSRFGQPYDITPRNPLSTSAGQVLGPGYGLGSGYQDNPANFSVAPSPDIIPSATSGAGKAPLVPTAGPTYSSLFTLPPSPQQIDANNAAATERDRIARERLQQLLQPYLMSY
jgi:hypothetical protein